MLSTLKQAFRSLRLAPAFTLTVIVTLGVGIGLNAAIFTVVDNVLLKPLGYHEADRIVSIRTHFNEENRSIPRLGGNDYVDLARDVHGLESTAQYQSGDDGFTLNGTSLYVPIANVTSAFADVLGVQPLAGRLLHAGDDHAKDALLSAAFVRNHFASPQAAIGQPITFSGELYTVVGVLPEGFAFPAKTEAWFQMPVAPGNRTSYNNRVVARRRAGVSVAQLNAELATFSSQLQRAFPEDRKKSIEAISLQELIVGRIRPMLQLLMGSVAVILLIVCANITHLQLVRATRQLRAVTIRTALGASRSQLALRGLVETAILAVAGTALALLIALPALHLLARFAGNNVPRLDDIHLNLDVFLFSLLISLVLMVVSALLPIWHSWHVDPAAALRSDASRGTESRASLRLRNGFIVAEVALTLMLSVAAILLTRQLIAQSHQDLGFSPDRLLTLDSHAVVPSGYSSSVASLDSHTVQTPEQKLAEQTRLDGIRQLNLQRLDDSIAISASAPGVQSAAAIGGAPLGFGGSSVGYAIRGRQTFNTSEKLPNAEIKPITPAFLTTLGLPLLRGRNITAQDTAATPTVVLINQALAEEQFHGQDPIGKQIMCGWDDTAGWYTIVGVVGDVRSESPGTLPYATFYAPVAQHRDRATDMQILVRTAADPAAIAETVRRALERSHPEIAIQATTMRANLAEVQSTDNFRTILFGSFAAVSILLAAIGMYGVTAYTVAQRRFEFGLRVALGANRTQLLTLVLRSAGLVALVGIVVGIALSLSLSRILASVLGKLPAFDFLAYSLASLAVLAIALAATLIPARRAAQTDPMQVLRAE